ncbi:MAG: PLP-dependent aminotransferase family protein, partial [Oscillospiraceae bacterium]|nr:PLP-dependent aminotransferase family protein [Oscillospiraceae bacterium]
MIHIDKGSRRPIYRQIYEQIRDSILNGTRIDGSKLPSIRVLANTLCVARNTVEYAYAQLCLEGFVMNRPGAGFFVSKVDRNFLPTTDSGTEQQMGANKSPGESVCRDQSVSEDLLSYIYEEGAKYQYDFQFSSIPEEVFPYSVWGKLTNEVLKSAERHKINVYNDKQGDAALREEIANYLRFSRGVQCSYDQIVLCCGMQYALNIICMLLADSITSFAIEEPSNDRIRTVIINNRHKLRPIPVRSDGIDVEALAHTEANAVFVTPSHQFPSGVLMSIQKRMQLLEWASQKSAI